MGYETQEARERAETREENLRYLLMLTFFCLRGTDRDQREARYTAGEFDSLLDKIEAALNIEGM